MLGRMAGSAHRLAIASLLGTALFSTGAAAQENGRYRLEGTETGYVRLDTQTGAISVCTQQKGQLVCKMAAEDRDAYENDIADLQARVKKLEAQVATMGKVEGSKASALPSEQEFEQSMSYMERFMRRFMDLAKSFEGGEEKPAPPAIPGRT
ncbi:hypothetical protein GJU94_01000 [Brucella sp. 10RB9214]|uniref:hypothetical protein n=1 Tax=unclassified Brucella TaxID=2632610 RepID=UPI00097274EC|nr:MULTISPECIES: hypothetical protein [unclassified Brucella]APY13522.1 hypothetical protein BKD02_03685 [Brucella sp. 09RB8910]MRN45217.1 hypothetical protein [Brucella sp. 10RB9212]MRN48415.1 hypothetical protein [Brucella sp. 10RB9214]